ncbi:connectin [Chelonus insularis]|uniref:connectin n=1 Tax=Chelonus insularis TaxID=460826 RepID=UPI00158A9C34|nr:connectin [Chelonus insularis]XP_034947116.1 connectin [Chelonus insularis]XP_034947117.1 connectin [Chelonus insularis]
MRNLAKLIIALQLCIYSSFSFPSSQLSVQTISNISPKHKGKKTSELNICNLEQRQAPMYCYCNHDEIGTATDANCLILETLKSDDLIWGYFNSQSAIEKLSLTVRVGGNMSHVPSKTIRLLPNLKVINIQYANIEEVAEKAFSDLPSITVINIARCGIINLKKHSFVNISKVDVINLDDNHIVEINREVFVHLPVLKKLFINRNNITFLHDRAFKHLTSLQELELSDNNISVITTDNFNGLKSLIRLILRSNKISMIGDSTFVEMPELRELELDGNMIEYISVNAFDKMRNLRKLSLSDNKLTQLEADVFAGATAINFLDLRNNSLVTMTFDNIKPIVTNFYGDTGYLYLEDNKLICDCNLAWIEGLKNETINQKLKDSLDFLTCFREAKNISTHTDAKEVKTGTAGGSTGEILDVNKSRERHHVQHETASYMDDNNKSDNDYYEDYPDSPSKTNNAKLQLVDGRMGYIKHLFELKLEKLPCPEQSRDDPLASEQPSNRRENAAVASEASTHIQHVVTIGQWLLLFAPLLLV